MYHDYRCGGYVSLVVDGGTVVDLEPPSVIENARVRIETGVVTAIGPRDRIEAAPGDDLLDADGCLVLPGFVIAHHHLYSALARGMSAPEPYDFVENLESVWWRLDRALTQEDVRLSAMAGLLDAVRFGVTTVVDHHSSPNAADGSLDIIADAAAQIGVRAVLSFEISDRNGAERFKAGLEENVRWAKSCATKKPGAFGHLTGLHASFTLDDKSLETIAERTDTPIHVHLCESPTDVEDARRLGYESPARRLDRFGLLRPGSVAVHAVHTDEDDARLLAERGVSVVWCPRSNMKNGVGRTPVERLTSLGVRVGLGCDGWSGSPLDDVRAGALVMRHEHAQTDCWKSAIGALATSARIAKDALGIRLVTISPGATADIACFPYDSPTRVDSSSVLAHIVAPGALTKAKHVIVDGKIVVRDWKHVSVDRETVHAEARAASSELWKRMEAI
jgi:cytosine/adenosine deaminase-related metal-dependent hydrolase